MQASRVAVPEAQVGPELAAAVLTYGADESSEEHPVSHHRPRTPSIALSLVLVAAAGGGGAATASAQVLGDFRPSKLTSPFGAVSEVVYETGLIDLPPGFLAHSPSGSERMFSFPEPVWIVEYGTAMYDDAGREPEENFLCHTFLGDRPFTQDHEPMMVAIYSDSFTRRVRLPEGFALHVPQGQPMHWLPLFNNRSRDRVRIGMRMTVSLIRDADLERPLTRLYSTLHSTHMPHLFFVPPSRHSQEAILRFGFNGRIHFMGTHVHPHAVSVGLRNLARNETVWAGRSRSGPSRVAGFDVYSSAAGYPVRAEESFRVTSVYDNPTDKEIDAMAGLFVLYSLDPQE